MARRHHYGFAHQVLRDLLFADPMRFFAALDDPRGPELLRRAWREFGKQFPADDRVEIDGLDCTKHELTSGLWCPVILVTLPPPQEVAEAVYAAAVLGGDARYFTLEHGISLAGDTPRTVLCEWQRGTHLNYGDGPPATPAAFLAAIEAKVNA